MADRRTHGERADLCLALFNKRVFSFRTSLLTDIAFAYYKVLSLKMKDLNKHFILRQICT